MEDLDDYFHARSLEPHARIQAVDLRTARQFQRTLSLSDNLGHEIRPS